MHNMVKSVSLTTSKNHLKLFKTFWTQIKCKVYSTKNYILNEHLIKMLSLLCHIKWHMHHLRQQSWATLHQYRMPTVLHSPHTTPQHSQACTRIQSYPAPHDSDHHSDRGCWHICFFGSHSGCLQILVDTGSGILPMPLPGNESNYYWQQVINDESTTSWKRTFRLKTLSAFPIKKARTTEKFLPCRLRRFGIVHGSHSHLRTRANQTVNKVKTNQGPGCK